jgi:peptide chain release factor 1
MIERLKQKLDGLSRRFDELGERMSQPEVAVDYEKVQEIAKERATLDRVVGLYREHARALVEIEGATSLIQGGDDSEIIALAREELAEQEQRRDRLEHGIQIALLPADPNDERSVIVEIRAGAGGEEAGLFASELFRMYSRYAAIHSWQVEIIDRSETGIGSLREVTFEVNGKGAYSRLKHESGVHRVQRVPITESGGRIHTSTATVAVLPEVDEVEIDIKADDLRIDIFHAGGHGGQNVQKVATAVRVVHIPTGTTAICQDERSQLKNKTKAMSVLRARIFDMEQRKQQEEITEQRRAQVGTADRSEKIRTYNYPQDRITDHRLDETRHNLPKFMEGRIDELIDALVAREQAMKLEQVAA